MALSTIVSAPAIFRHRCAHPPFLEQTMSLLQALVPPASFPRPHLNFTALSTGHLTGTNTDAPSHLISRTFQKPDTWPEGFILGQSFGPLLVDQRYNVPRRPSSGQEDLVPVICPRPLAALPLFSDGLAYDTPPFSVTTSCR